MIAIVLVSESLNTGIEKLSDFIHPEYHEKIKVIKDISAGAVGIAAIISLIVGGIIYIPKIALLF
jgi:diacylglycerol kinase (ATP)